MRVRFLWASGDQIPGMDVDLPCHPNKGDIVSIGDDYPNVPVSLVMWDLADPQTPKVEIYLDHIPPS